MSIKRIIKFGEKEKKKFDFVLLIRSIDLCFPVDTDRGITVRAFLLLTGPDRMICPANRWKISPFVKPGIAPGAHYYPIDQFPNTVKMLTDRQRERNSFRKLTREVKTDLYLYFIFIL